VTCSDLTLINQSSLSKYRFALVYTASLITWETTFVRATEKFMVILTRVTNTLHITFEFEYIPRRATSLRLLAFTRLSWWMSWVLKRLWVVWVRKKVETRQNRLGVLIRGRLDVVGEEGKRMERKWLKRWAGHEKRWRSDTRRWWTNQDDGE